MMNATKEKHNWTAFLQLFSEQNRMRPTRLGVFEGEPEAMTDYWIESGLPLMGVAVDKQEANAEPTIEIMLGDSTGADGRHLTHTAAGARLVKIILSAGGNADGLAIEDGEGRMTVLRFED